MKSADFRIFSGETALGSLQSDFSAVSAAII